MGGPLPQTPWMWLPAAAMLLGALILAAVWSFRLAISDARTRTLPGEMLRMASLQFAAALIILGSFAGPGILLTAASAAATLFLLLLGFAVLLPGALGGGDVKVAPFLGALAGTLCAAYFPHTLADSRGLIVAGVSTALGVATVACVLQLMVLGSRLCCLRTARAKATSAGARNITGQGTTNQLRQLPFAPSLCAASWIVPPALNLLLQ